MATATPYVFIGDIPEVLAKVDVSGFDLWVTFGGTKKGSSPTQGELDLGKQLAVSIYWEFEGLEGTSASESVSSGNPSATHAGDMSDMILPKEPDIGHTGFDPYRRSGSDEPMAGRQYSAGKATSVNGLLQQAFGGTSADGHFGVDLRLCRMYDGATNSEANFVGHGFLHSGHPWVGQTNVSPMFPYWYSKRAQWVQQYFNQTSPKPNNNGAIFLTARCGTGSASEWKGGWYETGTISTELQMTYSSFAMIDSPGYPLTFGRLSKTVDYTSVEMSNNLHTYGINLILTETTWHNIGRPWTHASTNEMTFTRIKLFDH